MKISPINNTQTSKSTNFKGIVDKSVIKYLDNVCLNNSNPQNAKIVANRILEKLTNFMKPLHNDTVFSVKTAPVLQSIILPFDDKCAKIDTETHLTYTLFSNKKTQTQFTLSDKHEFLMKGKQMMLEKGRFIYPFASENSLEKFEEHVDATIELFSNNNKDVDRILFNNMLISKRNRYSNLPDFIEKLRQKRIEANIFKMSKEFGMKPTEEKTTRNFVKYKANEESSTMGNSYTVRVAI
jgi:hypothetical protein